VIAVECPECQKRIQAPDNFAGKSARCPACRAPVPVPAAAPRPKPVAAKPPVARKGRRLLVGVLLGIAALVGLAAFVIVFSLVAGSYMSGKSDSLWDYAQKRIAADVADPETRGITLALARRLHLKAVHQSTPVDLRGRRGLSMPDPEPYYAALQSLIREELRWLEHGGSFNEIMLKDYWERQDSLSRTAYVVHLKSDGTYRDAAFDIADHRYETPSPMQGGTWQYKGGVLTWRGGRGKDDPNPVVRKSPYAFVLKEMDGHYTYFRQINAPPGLRELLR
jgi:hypothetical protein